MTLFVILSVAGSPAAEDLDDPKLPEIMPPGISVLLLPALDMTKDSAHMLAPRRLVIHHRAQFEFISRRFKVLGDSMAVKAAESLPAIDLADESGRSSQNLDALAKRTGTDWVVNIVVEEAKLNSAAGGTFTVRTRALLQIWDAQRQDWLTNGTYTGEVSGGGSPIFVFKNSLDAAVKGSLEKVLDGHPRVVPVSDEDSLKDYLAGQTAPFIGEPGKPFSGLKGEH